MVFFNHATRQMTAKIVYYGPGLCGKTTNLNTIYAKTTDKARGEMVSLNTETDRTLFFDLLPMDVGVVGGFRAKLQLYTVPGQVFYNSTRKLVLKGVDGIVFVADSQSPMLDANKESLKNLEENLRELGLDLSQIPMVFQWNKRDLKNIVELAQMESELNTHNFPSFQSVAADGTGVFETLRGITRLALATIKSHHFPELAEAASGSDSRAVTSTPPPPPPPPVIEPPPVPVQAQPEALDLSDLPSVDELLSDMHVAPPAPVAPPKASPLSLPRPVVASAPEAKGSVDKPAVPALKFSASPPKVALPHLEVPKPKLAAPVPLIGDRPNLTAPASSTLRLELPADAEGELEIRVEILSKGTRLVEGHLKQAAPSKTAVQKIVVELKRS